MRIPRRIREWAYTLVGGCIGGGAGAIVQSGSMLFAKAAGMDVPALNLKAIGILFVGGVISHAAMFLAKSPLPPLDGGDTTFTTNTAQKTETKTSP